MADGVNVGIGVGDEVGTPVGEGVAPEVGTCVAVGTGVGTGVAVGVAIGVGVGVRATTPFPVPRRFTVALALPLDASLPMVTVVVNTAFAGGAKDTIAVALACGASTVPLAGSRSIENAAEGFIVMLVMVSGALPVFRMMNFEVRVATRPNRRLAGATTSLLKSGVGRAWGETCSADAPNADAKMPSTQAQTAAANCRCIAPRMRRQRERQRRLKETTSRRPRQPG